MSAPSADPHKRKAEEETKEQPVAKEAKVFVSPNEQTRHDLMMSAISVTVKLSFESLELAGILQKSEGLILDGVDVGSMRVVAHIVSSYLLPSWLEQICEDDEPLFDADDLCPKFRLAIHDLWEMYAVVNPDAGSEKVLDKAGLTLMLKDCYPGLNTTTDDPAGHVLDKHGDPLVPRRKYISKQGLEEEFFKIRSPREIKKQLCRLLSCYKHRQDTDPTSVTIDAMSASPPPQASPLSGMHSDEEDEAEEDEDENLN